MWKTERREVWKTERRQVGLHPGRKGVPRQPLAATPDALQRKEQILMSSLRHPSRPSAGLVVSVIALIVALGGTSYAAFTCPRTASALSSLRTAPSRPGSSTTAP
jgi:hypothetical protein